MMKKLRSPFAGGTDYTAVPLPELIIHLKNWKANTDYVIAKIRTLRSQIIDQKHLLTQPQELDSYIESLTSSFRSYSEELSRLIKEIPKGVKSEHASAIRQMQAHCWKLDGTCRTLRDEDFTKDENIRFNLIEEIYTECRSLVYDYVDLNNLASRLDVLIGEHCYTPVTYFIYGTTTAKTLTWTISILTALLIAWLSKRLGFT